MIDSIADKKTQDLQAFSAKLLRLKNQALADLSRKDYLHLRKIIWTNRLFLLVGFGTAWLYPNPLSIICMSIGLHGQWTIVAHHVCHGGYDQVPTAPARYHSNRFALGWRRFLDWCDWMYPPAWKYEHNVLHHFYTNENLDPDVSSERIKHYINPKWPVWRRFLVLALNICTWKITYYSMNTLKALSEKKQYNNKTSPSAYFKQAVRHSYIPYISFHFILIPLLFLPLGSMAVLYVLINRLGAEILTNIHSFLTIVPNHAGADIPLQSKHFANKEEFYVAQVKSASNFNTGGFWRDYMQGYLNYQIEHHLFPDLPLSQYVKMQPQVKALCAEYGIPYKQESIFKRIVKTFKVLLLIEQPVRE